LGAVPVAKLRKAVAQAARAIHEVPMFAKLTGTVDSVAEDHLVLDVGGVGYLVACSSRTLAQLSAGTRANLLIDTQVGEDHIRLFGFLRADEQRWFRMLQSVQGVGARVALAVLSVLPPDLLTTALAAQDKSAVGRATGVGPKLAQRIVTELKDKVGGVVIAAPSASAALPAVGADAVSALVNLGYKPVDAQIAINAAAARLGADAAFEALVRAGLKELAR
jgi:holliday junction DNA helicase RuvA